MGKFLATSTTNLSLCLYKDAQFTRLFGPVGKAAAPLPGATYAVFALRDSLTVYASFNLPPVLARHLPLSDAAVERAGLSRLSAAQLLAPAAMQLASTPLHLLGLDWYNRPGGARHVVPWRSRVAKVVRDWPKTAVARMCRIVPAFGVGGVVNTKVRRRLMGALEE